MEGLWEKSKIDVYFETGVADEYIRQGFNNLVNDASGEQVNTFIETLGELHELPAAYAIVTDSHRYNA